MKNKLSQAIAASVLAAGLLFAAPAVAQAYTPTGPNTTTITITAGGTYDFSGFTAGADVTFTLVGENAAGASLAYAKLAVNSSSPVTKTASETGVATVSVTLPSNASGSYELSATGTRASSEAGGSSTLPSTGGDSDSLLGIWIGGGALVLAGATIAVGASVRRGRQQADA